MMDIEEKAKQIAEDLLTKMEFPFTAVAVTIEGNNIIRVNIDTEETSMLIGWHGETINAFQHILKSLLWSKMEIEKSFFLIVDTDGYKKRQEESVIDLAEQRAKALSETTKVVALPPMSPYFRRIIHLYFANNPDFSHVTTVSEGEGDMRQIKMIYKKTA